jgi:hypothetical protein
MLMETDPFEGAEAVSSTLTERIIESYAFQHGISLKLARETYLQFPTEMYLEWKSDNDV